MVSRTVPFFSGCNMCLYLCLCICVANDEICLSLARLYCVLLRGSGANSHNSQPQDCKAEAQFAALNSKLSSPTTCTMHVETSWAGHHRKHHKHHQHHNSNNVLDQIPASTAAAALPATLSPWVSHVFRNTSTFVFLTSGLAAPAGPSSQPTQVGGRPSQ